MKIAVFMKNWVGDTFFQLPAIAAIRANRPDAEITCMAPPRCRDLLNQVPGIKQVLEFDEKSIHRSWLKRLAFIRELRALGPWDEGYLFHRSRTRAAILKLAGVKKTYGYGFNRGFWLTRAVPEPPAGLHHVDYFSGLMRGLGMSLPSQPVYELPVSEEAAQKADALLQNSGVSGENHFVCFHLGANWEPKRWPPEYFAALADKIHDEWKIPAAVTGSPNDRPLFEAMAQKVKRARIFDFVGRTALDVLGALYSQAAFVVSGDSGPMHVAASVGTPVLALFGPTNPDLTGPRGTGDAAVLKYVPEGYSAPFLGDAAEAQNWLRQITPEQAFEAIRVKGWIA